MKKLTTLTGPSCAGKSTLECMMVERGCAKAISTTTRSPRAGEVDGVDYYFVSKERFASMKLCNMFVEHVEFGEHSYGLSVPELNRLYTLSNHVVVVCEPVGASQIKSWARSQPGVVLTSVFVDNPSQVIADRFLRRVVQDAINSNGSAMNSVITSYSKRMAMMIDMEPTWRNASSEITYDLTFKTFDESNCTDVADILCGVASTVE